MQVNPMMRSGIKQLHTMIHFFGNQTNTVFAVQAQNELSTEDINKLNWLFGNAHKIEKSALSDFFVRLVPLW